MEVHFAERISLEQICRYAGLSKSTLLRAFTKSKGVTPYSYLENIRIGKAKKLLEKGVAPIDAFFRFVMGFLILCFIYPHRLLGTSRKQELTFAAAGFAGICLYYLLENIALTATMASNVGVIISIAPFFTAILSHIFLKEEGYFGANFFIGFLIAMIGICLISFNGTKLQLNPMGDLLALFAAFVWACYSVLTKKIGSFSYNTILTTRRVFFYGILR